MDNNIKNSVEWPQPIYVHIKDSGAELSLRRVAQDWKRINVVPASSLRALTDAVGNAAVIHLVAGGPVRLIESEWREIEAKAMDARRVLVGME